MSQKISLTATVKNVSVALNWILDMKATSVTLTIDPENNTAEFRHSSKMGELIPGYREHPIICEGTKPGVRKCERTQQTMMVISAGTYRGASLGRKTWGPMMLPTQ